VSVGYSATREHHKRPARASTGPSLAAVVSGFEGPVSLAEVDPLEYVHAKRVGIVAGKHGPLLTGSANVSLAALLEVSESWANVEACVAVELPAERTRHPFLPPGHCWQETSLDHLTELEFSGEDRPSGSRCI
jgi:hypothetical protein